MFDAKGHIVQWYIDICYQNGISENNVPWMDDLFLDLIVLPSGELIKKDAAEIEQAYNSGVISKELYDLAWKESDKLAEMIKRGEFALPGLSNLHKELLFQMLDVKD